LKQKNPEGILRAFEKLVKSGIDAELQMVGRLNDRLKRELAERNHLKDRLIISGELSYEEVAIQMKNASAFVLFSQVENLPCVILESLCCGIPVIATSVGGISEVVGSENGILVEPGNEAMLADAMQRMVQKYSMYDKPDISRKACALFNYQRVGAEYAKTYKQVLRQNN
jgi:glycosyltransferase involved in cell wall biosynthesis